MSEDVQAKIDGIVKGNKVVVFMKGNPDFPQCGFSGAVAQIFQSVGAPFAHVDVIDQPEFREEIKQYSKWPTIPQVFIDGKMIGGCDIVKDMFESGELQKLIGDSVPPPTA